MALCVELEGPLMLLLSPPIPGVIRGQLASGHLQVICWFWTSYRSKAAGPGIGVGTLLNPQALLSLWFVGTPPNPHSGAGTGGQTMSHLLTAQ